MSLQNLQIDQKWTLFLDRDGIINKWLDRYVIRWEEFQFLPDFLSCAPVLSNKFGKLIIVTNQRCVGQKMITEAELKDIHLRMLETIRRNGAKIDRIYYCPHNIEDNCICRKPKPGMGLLAKKDFNDIDFSKSIMIGDHETDMEFGKNLGMITVLISKKGLEEKSEHMDYSFADMNDFLAAITAVQCVSSLRKQGSS